MPDILFQPANELGGTEVHRNGTGSIGGGIRLQEISALFTRIPDCVPCGS